MIQRLSAAWVGLSEDLLVFRVMFFNLGLLVAALPIAAFVTGTATEVNDGSFYVVLGLLFAFGAFLLYVATLGTKRLMSFSAWLVVDDILVIPAILALVTLAVPITIAIKTWRTRHA